MRWCSIALTMMFMAAVTRAEAAEARHFSFAYDQPHTTAYGIAADTFGHTSKAMNAKELGKSR
jgi:hypothetical protein